jgi:hypothetical protein
LDEIGLVVYEEMSFKVKVYRRTTDGRTPDGRRTKSNHKSSPCHFGQGNNGFELMGLEAMWPAIPKLLF